MKPPRFGSRSRLSRDAAQLQYLSLGLSESGSRLEDNWWEARLSGLVDQMLEGAAEDDLAAALERLSEHNHAIAHDELISLIEARAETAMLPVGGKKKSADEHREVLLFAAPVLAWSRYEIPALVLPEAVRSGLEKELRSQVVAQNAQVVLADLLYSPDHLPRSFCETWLLTRQLGMAALSGKDYKTDTSTLPETNRFLSDVRYLVGGILLQPGQAPFRWNEPDGERTRILQNWEKNGSALLSSRMVGSSFQLLLPNAYHTACREADRAARPFALSAAIAYLHVVLDMKVEHISATIGPCYDLRLEEYRIGFAARGSEEVFYGVAWPIFSAEEEHSDVLLEIETTLRHLGVTDVVGLEHRFPMEFCDDCGAPLFPSRDGQMVHPAMPEMYGDNAATLH